MSKKYTLKELRLDREETQQLAAESIGINRAAYSHYENGRRTPKVNVAERIAKHFGVKIDDIFFLRSNDTERHNEETA